MKKRTISYLLSLLLLFIGLFSNCSYSNFDFCYATGNGKWEMLCRNIDTGYLPTTQTVGFTGTTIGIIQQIKINL